VRWPAGDTKLAGCIRRQHTRAGYWPSVIDRHRRSLVALRAVAGAARGELVGIRPRQGVSTRNAFRLLRNWRAPSTAPLPISFRDELSWVIYGSYTLERFPRVGSSEGWRTNRKTCRGTLCPVRREWLRGRDDTAMGWGYTSVFPLHPLSSRLDHTRTARSWTLLVPAFRISWRLGKPSCPA